MHLMSYTVPHCTIENVYIFCFEKMKYFFRNLKMKKKVQTFCIFSTLPVIAEVKVPMVREVSGRAVLCAQLHEIQLDKEKEKESQIKEEK